MFTHQFADVTWFQVKLLTCSLLRKKIDIHDNQSHVIPVSDSDWASFQACCFSFPGAWGQVHNLNKECGASVGKWNCSHLSLLSFSFHSKRLCQMKCSITGLCSQIVAQPVLYYVMSEVEKRSNKKFCQFHLRASTGWAVSVLLMPNSLKSVVQKKSDNSYSIKRGL